MLGQSLCARITLARTTTMSEQSHHHAPKNITAHTGK